MPSGSVTRNRELAIAFEQARQTAMRLMERLDEQDTCARGGEMADALFRAALTDQLEYRLAHVGYAVVDPALDQDWINLALELARTSSDESAPVSIPLPLLAKTMAAAEAQFARICPVRLDVDSVPVVRNR